MADSIDENVVAEVQTMQASVRAWVTRMATDSARGLRRMPSAVLLSLLCAAAFTPVIGALVGLGAAAAAGVTGFSALGGGVLSELLAGAVERVRESGTNGDSAPGDLEREISKAIERALSADDGAAAELRAENRRRVQEN